MAEQKLLYRVDSPEDLRKLSRDELVEYSGELRRFIIEQLSSNPGHLGSSLGVVELSVALHYTYDTPNDKIIWDVGHQAYAHKIITGRRDVFHTNRKLGGISGFPRMSESEYDAFGVGHASTSISAALGIATASALEGKKRDVVAVIGDGALTGGLAFEGLNNAGTSNTDILVILNDNRMSIDPNVGAMKEYLLSITTSRKYNIFKYKTWHGLEKLPRLRRAVQKLGNAVKLSLLQQSNLFEGLHFRYFGPVDGHDIAQLTQVLKDLRNIPGPKLLHVMTVKGKGYRPAEQNQKAWHAPGVFNPETGERMRRTREGTPPLYQEVFGETMLELARSNDKIVGITPAMPTGCSLDIMMREIPERCFDVGIAEGHAVTFSAGMAATGLLPFCNIYSSFMQRAYDNVIHDTALQGLHVVFCLDRAGLVGEDGATHHGVFDISAFRSVPGVTIMSPMDETELRNMMYTASVIPGTYIIRYPRGRGLNSDWRKSFARLEIGKGRILTGGKGTALLTIGPVGNDAAEAVKRAAEAEAGINITHVDMRFVKPLDEELLRQICSTHSRIITVEDGVISGGFGSAVLDAVNAGGYDCSVEMLGVPDTFIEHGTIDQLRAICGYDAKGIYRKIRNN